MSVNAEHVCDSRGGGGVPCVIGMSQENAFEFGFSSSVYRSFRYLQVKVVLKLKLPLQAVEAGGIFVGRDASNGGKEGGGALS